MSICKICHRDSEKHSEKLWLLHKQKIKCSFCGENSSKHSVELWDIHQKAVPKNAKLVTMQQGFGPSTLAKIVEWNTVKVNGRDDPYHMEFIPISIPCSKCGSSMSSTETDLADVLSSHCFKCFADVTDQEYSWHSKPWWTINGGKYKE